MTNKEFIKNISLESEEWKPVVGYEDYYSVSSFGRVMSNEKILNRKSKSGLWYKQIQEPHLCKLQISNRGYYVVMLTINYKRKMMYVHRMVAQAFIPNPNNLPQIDHIDTNRLNPVKNNLKWCTQSENNLNEISKSKRSIIMKGRQAQHKWIPIVRINPFDNSIFIYKNISSSKEDGFCTKSIYDCLKGRSKQHKGFKWMYLSDYNQINKSKNLSY